MGNKQTAVEWLQEKLPSLFQDDSGHYQKLFQQAKAMEKEQIVDAFDSGQMEEAKQEYEIKDFESSGILDVLNIGNVEYLGNGDIIYNPNLFFIKRGDKWFIKTEEPKQETLEEATKKWITKNSGIKLLLTPEFVRESFKEGAKWQAERMYSEEELKSILQFFVEDTRGDKPWVDADDEWFEQFKK
jgi:hypothetical protein